MAVKCVLILGILSFLGVVCAREMQLASKLKVDPGIFISLETLRRLEERAKNNGTDTNEITTPAEELDSVDDNEVDISTTSTPDNENEVSNEETAGEDVEKDNDAASGSESESATSNPNQQPNGNVQWSIPFFHYPYFPYFIPNPLNNQQNPGYYPINPLVVNEEVLKNNSQPILVHPPAPNQYYQPTYIGQQPYPLLQQINPQMNLVHLNPNLMPLPYSQMYQPAV